VKIKIILIGSITFGPVMINKNEFVYLADGNFYEIKAYDIQQTRDSLAFVQCGGFITCITCITRSRHDELITSDLANYIRIWNTLNRNCKRVLFSYFTCYTIIPLNCSFLAIGSHAREGDPVNRNKFIQTWNNSEFNSQPMLFTSDMVEHLVILNKYIIIVLLSNSHLEVWNIYTQKRIRYYESDNGIITIHKVNSFVFCAMAPVDYEGVIFELYDYREDKPLMTTEADYSEAFCNIDDCSFACVNIKEGYLFIYDTKQLRVVKQMSSTSTLMDIVI
jgi:hypothetical protein